MLLLIAAWFTMVAVAIRQRVSEGQCFKGRVWPAMLVWVAIAPYLFYWLHA
jgi:hypothetical protein